MKPNKGRPSVRIPARTGSLLARLESGGHEAYIYGTSVLDLMYGKPPGRPDVVTDNPAEGEYDAIPLLGTVKSTLRGVPSPVLALYADREGNIHDPYNALPALSHRALTAKRDAVPADMDARSALALLALASRYGLSIGPSTARGIRQAGAPAGNDPETRKWLRLFLSGNRVADLMESYDGFFMELVPELAPCRGLHASAARHAYDVYGHMARSVQACRTDSHAVRMALLLHDVGKPDAAVRTETGTRFRQHALIGRDIADDILSRLGYPTLFRYQVTDLVLYHDQPITPEKFSLDIWMRRLGPDGIAQLMEMKRADIIAHNERTGRRLICQWEDTRAYLMQQGINIPPEAERKKKK